MSERTIISKSRDFLRILATSRSSYGKLPKKSDVVERTAMGRMEHLAGKAQISFRFSIFVNVTQTEELIISIGTSHASIHHGATSLAPSRKTFRLKLRVRHPPRQAAEIYLACYCWSCRYLLWLPRLFKELSDTPMI
jgi:hypothetical protein